MAEIKNYELEKKRINKNKEKSTINYKNKIKEYRKVTLNRILFIGILVSIFIMIIAHRYQNHYYTDYDIISSKERNMVSQGQMVVFNQGFLGYSADGAYYQNAIGESIWNISFQMQTPIVKMGENVVILADYDGQIIYVVDTQGEQTEIKTNMPIKNLTISDNGVVAAILSDKEISWIYVYDLAGNILMEARTSMPDFGYPVSFALSPNGALLVVSFLAFTNGEMETTINFFNLTDVGQSQLDNLVAIYSLGNTIAPVVGFMNEEIAYVINEDGVGFYTGKHSPGQPIIHFLDGEIQSVYVSDEYLALIFWNTKGSERYRLEIYDKNGNKVTENTFDLEYTNFFFDKDTYIIYNEKKCLISTIAGQLKYEGGFLSTVQLMYPTNRKYQYNVITSESIDVISLK